MNERIQELADQARDWGYAEHSGYTAQLLFEQKFAEWIFKECAEVADNADATREKWQSIGKFVKEHFGVEE